MFEMNTSLEIGSDSFNMCVCDGGRGGGGRRYLMGTKLHHSSVCPLKCLNNRC